MDAGTENKTLLEKDISKYKSMGRYSLMLLCRHTFECLSTRKMCEAYHKFIQLSGLNTEAAQAVMQPIEQSDDYHTQTQDMVNHFYAESSNMSIDTLAELITFMKNL